MRSPGDAVTVVIPNWNGAERLPATLAAVAAQERRPAAVLVVDNGSTDGSDALAEATPGVEVLRLGSNRGFGAAANAGLARCTTPNLALLNSDARPRPDWLAVLAESGPAGDDVWAWGSVLVGAGDGRIESAGDYVRASGMSGKHLRGEPLSALPGDPYPVLAPPGAAPLVRVEVVRSLGGWFEPYFLYFEDLDLALRARLAGLRCHLVPTALVEHDLAGSSGGVPPWRLVGRASTWCAVRSNPQLSLAGLARLHVEERRVAHHHHRSGQWAVGKVEGLVTLPWRLRERRVIMREAVDRAWMPGPPSSR